MILLLDLIPTRSEFRFKSPNLHLSYVSFVFHHNTSYGYTACITRTGRSCGTLPSMDPLCALQRHCKVRA